MGKSRLWTSTHPYRACRVGSRAQSSTGRKTFSGRGRETRSPSSRPVRPPAAFVFYLPPTMLIFCPALPQPSHRHPRDLSHPPSRKHVHPRLLPLHTPTLLLPLLPLLIRSPTPSSTPSSAVPSQPS